MSEFHDMHGTSEPHIPEATDAVIEPLLPDGLTEEYREVDFTPDYMHETVSASMPPCEAVIYLARNGENGRGTVVVDLQDAPQLEWVYDVARQLDPDAAFTTPAAADIQVPPAGPIEPGDVYRGPLDWRSFSVATSGVPDVGSITVKGGDLAYMRALCGRWHSSPARRIMNREIPGSALRDDAMHEFAVARDMQTEALSVLGRPTHTALPLRVSSIEEVRDDNGQLMPVRDYMNTDQYMQTPDWLRMRLEMKPEEGLGDVLIGRYGLQPTQYIYATPGLNVRVYSLVNSRHFRANDIGYGQQGIDTVLERDQLYYTAEGMQVHGDLLPQAEGRKDATFRQIYRLLADAYDFDAADVLPRTPIDDTNYFRALRTIPKACEQQGIDTKVLHGFIGRVTEVAALLHAQEMTFSAEPDVGSSFMSRNVTYDGTVLDLDTVGTFAREPESHIAQDYSEMLLTIASLRRAVSGTPAYWTAEVAFKSYLEHLQVFGATPAWQRRIRAALSKSDTVDDAIGRL